MKLSFNLQNSTKAIVILLLIYGGSAKSQENDLKINEARNYVYDKCPCEIQKDGSQWTNKKQYMICVTKAVLELLKKRGIKPIEALKIEKEAYYSNCGNPNVEEPLEGSDGILTLEGAYEKNFNPKNLLLKFTLSQAQFSTDIGNHLILLNEEPIHPSDIKVTPTGLSFSVELNDGENLISVFFGDTKMQIIEGQYKLWAGASLLPVSVTDQNNNLIPNAKVTVKLSDDTSVVASGITDGGNITFSNIPLRTLIVTAEASGNLFGTAASVGDGSTVVIKLIPFKPISTIDNNDFSLGTTGWDIGTAPVSIIDHTEAIQGASIKNSLTNDKDLLLGTLGQGEQSVSRTFTIKPGTKNISLRYKFITSEVPGGYFGSQYNDYYSVSIRGLKSSKKSSEQNSMNGLGLSAFEFSTGTTAWKEISFPVDETGESVQVDATVANVGDGLYDSQIVLDLVDEKKLAINTTQLIDRDKKDEKPFTDQLVNPLEYVSIDNHSYFNGTNPIFGKISIKGASDDKLTKLNLEILKGGTVVQTVPLTNSAQTALYKSFGPAEKIEITDPILLFEIPASSPFSANTSVLLRLYAETQKGESTTKDYKTLPALSIYKGTNRYPPRNEDEGGDGWGLPSTIAFCNTYTSGWLIGDVSNINAGSFKPPHGWHDIGLDFDGDYAGFDVRDKTVAESFISYLNGPAGKYVSLIGILYDNKKNSTDVFYNTIKDVVLNDKRKAVDVIRPWAGHDDHFHIRLKAAVGSATLKQIKQMSRRENLVADLNNTQILNNVKLYPNPAKDFINLSLQNLPLLANSIKLSSIYRIVIFDRFGMIQKEYKYGPNSKNVTIQVSSLPSNSYRIKVIDDKNQTVLIPLNVIK